MEATAEKKKTKTNEIVHKSLGFRPECRVMAEAGARFLGFGYEEGGYYVVVRSNPDKPEDTGFDFRIVAPGAPIDDGAEYIGSIHDRHLFLLKS